MREVPAVVVATNAAYTGGDFLPVDTWGAKTWAHVQRAQQWEVGDVKWSAIARTADYDANGVGKPGTTAWGWGLCDGQNGRADLRGNFVAGLDPARADYDTVGKTGGKESITLETPQIPAHKHTTGNRITNENKGDAGAYTAALTASPNASGKDIVTNDAGGGQPHENRPPYYVLAARQWVGY